MKSPSDSKTRTLRGVAMALSVVTLALCLADVAAACPSCKAALANQRGKGDLLSGFMYSIIFMLSMPFAIFGSLSGYFYLLVRRARRQQPADQASAPGAAERQQ